MPNERPQSPRPEAGADTEQGRRGEAPDHHPADSGGKRTPAGSTYGDYVPNRGQPRENDDRDAGTPVTGDHAAGRGHPGGLAGEPGLPHPAQAVPETPGRAPTDSTLPEKEETASEANRNKTFDTTHVHSGTTSRRV